MLINKLKKFFFKENFNKKKIKDIVENIIKISKSEIFYQKYKIPKIFLSRFEIIIIFVFLLFNRLKKEKKSEIRLQKFSFRIKIYEKSFEKDLNNIRKPVKKYIYNNSNTKSIVINKFVKYILSENKKLEITLINKIFIKNCFLPPK